MKVVKYYLTVQITKGDKEEKIERTFRHLKNAKEFVKELLSKQKEKLKCGDYEQKDGLLVRECSGEKVKIKINIKTERIKKAKKEGEKKESGKEQKKEEQKSQEEKKQQ